MKNYRANITIGILWLMGTLCPAMAGNYASDSMAVRAILDSNGLADVAVETVSDTADNRITALKLYELGLTVLPDIIGTLDSLHGLYLWNNSLTQLPDTLGALGALEMLDVSSNFLDSLPRGLFRCSRLQELWAGYNTLSALPAETGRLLTLKVLNCIHNMLTAMPDSLINLRELTELEMSGNNLSSLLLPTLPCSLRVLSVARNIISALPDSIGRYTALRALNVEGNRLDYLPRSCLMLDSLYDYASGENTLNVDSNNLAVLTSEITGWINAHTVNPNWSATQRGTSAIKKQDAKSTVPSQISIRQNGSVLVMTIPAAMTGPITMRLYTAAGRLVLTRHAGAVASDKINITESIESLSPGGYVLTIGDDHQSMIRMCVIH